VVTPDLQSILICEDVRLEANGFNTLVGVINVIATPITPFRIMKLCCFTRWINGQGSFTQGLRILSPDEREITSAKSSFQLSNPEIFATNVSVFGGIEFREAGDYPIEVTLDDELILRFPLRVVLISPSVTPQEG